VKPPASNTGRSAAALGLRSAAGTRPGHAQTSDRRLTRPVSGFLAFRRVCDALTCRDAAMCVQIRLSAAERRITNQGQSLKEDGYRCLTGPQPATTAPAPAATTSTITAGTTISCHIRGPHLQGVPEGCSLTPRRPPPRCPTSVASKTRRTSRHGESSFPHSALPHSPL
jgi:hypothetical protein